MSKELSDLIDARLLKAMVDAANDGITVAEREGDDTVLIYVNAAFERLTGYSAEEILYRDCRFLQNDDRDQPAREEIHVAMASGEPCRVVLRNYRKDGTMFWNELSITPYFSEEDQLTYYIGVQKDVTDVMKLRQQLAAKAR